MQLYYFCLYFFTYGFLGWCTEVAFAAIRQGRFVNRGFLNGPICPVYGIGIGAVTLLLKPVEDQLVLLYIASTILVTLIEGLTGYLMDKIFHHKWWDYTNQPLNIGGYVCLIFSLVWGVACVVIVKVIHPVIHKGLSILPVPLGIGLIVVMGIGLFADLYVTASAILKLNKRLDAMEKIAGELREFSDKFGEGIYENVRETKELSEDTKAQLDVAAAEIKRKLEELPEVFETATEEQRSRAGEQKLRLEEQKAKIEEQKAHVGEKLEEKMRIEQQKAHIAELKEKYVELAGGSTRISRRLLQAFPKMESRRHKEILEELKVRLKHDQE